MNIEPKNECIENIVDDFNSGESESEYKENNNIICN